MTAPTRSLRRTAAIELRTLGALRLRHPDGRDLCAELQPKRQALLIYLAQAPRRFHRRDSLLALFWPELDFERGRNTLRQSLYALRRTLGHGVLEARGYEEVALADAVRSDVEAFESALDAGEPERALELYRGNFLEGFHVQSVSADFEHWLETERLRLRNKAVRAAIALREREEDLDRLQEAVRWAHAACRLDPSNESLLGSLIDLLDRVGDRAGAVRAYEAFDRRVREEYDLAPSAETQARIEALRTHREPDGPAARATLGISEPLTSFIGREPTLARLEALLREPSARLVTLTGLGGSGKSRLALALTRRVEGGFADGVVLVGLGEGRGSRGIVPAVARALGLAESAPGSLRRTLHRHLAERECLLVLDGCERVREAGHDILELLRAAPRLKVLVTSRVRLKVRGERDFPVPPLTLPQTRLGPSLEFPLSSEAVALFADRARAARPDFALSVKNLEAVAEICRRLDGLPLAIELAAARVRSLTPQAIAKHLEDRFAFLTGDFVDLPARQRTLEATIAWSHDLLDDRERELYRRLAAFAGGFGLDLVEPLCEAWGISAGELLDGLATLVDLGLVVQRETAGEPRFAMLDTVRAYARQLLAESGEEDACGRRHAAVVLAWAEEGERHYCTAGQEEWLRRIDQDHDNARAALAWAIDAEDGDVAVRLAAAVWPFWWSRGYLTEAEEWLDRALALESPGSGVARGKALSGACWIALASDRYERAIELAEESLPLFRAAGDEPGLLRSLETLGFAHLEAGDLGRAREIFEECLEGSRESGDDRRRTIALNALGQLALARGDEAGAERVLDESVALARRAALPDSVAHGLLRLGDVARRRGDPARAIALYEEALAGFCELGQTLNVAWTMASLGNALLDRGRVADARERYAESLEIFREHGYAGGTARALMGFAGVAIARGNAEHGAKLLGGIQELVARGGRRLPTEDADSFASLRVSALEKLREATFTARWSEGAALAPDAVLALARAEDAAPRHRAIG